MNRTNEATYTPAFEGGLNALAARTVSGGASQPGDLMMLPGQASDPYCRQSNRGRAPAADIIAEVCKYATENRSQEAGGRRQLVIRRKAAMIEGNDGVPDYCLLPTAYCLLIIVTR